MDKYASPYTKLFKALGSKFLPRVAFGTAAGAAGHFTEKGISNVTGNIGVGGMVDRGRRVGTGPLLTGLYAMAIGPRNFIKSPHKIKQGLMVSAPSVGSGLYHGLINESSNPVSAQNKIWETGEVFENLNEGDEGRRKIGHKLWEATEEDIRNAWEKNKVPVFKALEDTGMGLLAGTGGAMAGVVITSLLLTLLPESDPLETEGSLSEKDMDKFMDESEKKEKRDNILKILGSLSGGLLVGYGYNRYINKESYAIKAAIPALKMALKKAAPRVGLAAGAYTAHPYVENIVSGGVDNMGGGSWSRERLLPEISGEDVMDKAVTGTLSSGGTRLLSAIAAGLMGPKNLGSLRGATVGVAPSVFSGVTHKVWPGEGIAAGLRTTQNAADFAGKIVGDPQEVQKVIEPVVQGYRDKVKEFYKADVFEEAKPELKKLGYLLLSAGAGGIMGNLISGSLSDASSKSDKDIKTREDIRKYIQDREKRQGHAKITRSVGTLGGAVAGVILFKYLEDKL